MKRSTIYRHALSAVAIPLVTLGFGVTTVKDPLLEAVLRMSHGGWLLLGLGAVLLIVELGYVLTLTRLARAGWNIEAFQATAAEEVTIARRHRRRMRLIAMGVSSVFTLCLAEAAFRIFDIHPAPPPRLSKFDNAEVDNTLNAMGIREAWDSLSADDRRLRIAFLGDSMVYGLGVEREEGFVHLVEGLLAGDHPDGVVTINMGYPGTAPHNQLKKYLALRDQLRPDIVVHVAYLNDMGIQMHRYLTRIYRVYDDQFVLGKWSYLLHYAERQFRFWVAWKETVNYFRGGRTPQERARAWGVFEKGIHDCKAAVEKGGGRYVLALLPWLVRLKDYPLAREHVQMREIAEALDVPYVDLLDTFIEHREEHLFISPMNEHPTPLGHEIAAERFARFLREEVLTTMAKDE